MTPFFVRQNDYDAVLVTYHDNGPGAGECHWMLACGEELLVVKIWKPERFHTPWKTYFAENTGRE